MKLVSYKLKGTDESNYRIGCLIDDKVIDIQESYRLFLLSRVEQVMVQSIEEILPADPTTFFSIGESAIERAKEACAFIQNYKDKEDYFIDREKVNLGTPNPDPGKIICVGRNYAEHAKEMDSDVPEFPVLFAKFSNALIGPEDAIEKSPYTKKLDYEVELGVVIGKEARHVKREDAYDYIAGYTIGNDITARDMQKRTPQWLQGKSLDRSTPVGPWVVTADKIKNPDQLVVRSFVNGEKRQASDTSKFIFDIPYLIEFISHIMTLQPGDLILTGTPDGVGVAMDPPQFLQAGDVVTLEIEHIGQLENKVIVPNKRSYNGSGGSGLVSVSDREQ